MSEDNAVSKKTFYLGLSIVFVLLGLVANLLRDFIIDHEKIGLFSMNYFLVSLPYLLCYGCFIATFIEYYKETRKR